MVLSALAAAVIASPTALPRPPHRQPKAARTIVASALDQARIGALYDARYIKLAYPMGDVPQDRGACSDVVVRALRAAGYDLQVLIFQDMARADYPREGARRDRNIDHRRVANQRFFFARFGQSLPIRNPRASQFKPGDFVTWKLPNNLDHIGVVIDEQVEGRPLIVHNISKTQKEDVLFMWKLTGHYRFPR